MRNLILTLAAVGSLALAARADWKKMDGQQVPEISAKEWQNAGRDGPTTAALRGKVYLLEFFATW